MNLEIPVVTPSPRYTISPDCKEDLCDSGNREGSEVLSRHTVGTQ